MARHGLQHAAQPINQPSVKARVPERSMERASERQMERRLERPDNRRLTDDGRFSIDLNAVPPGYVCEWKRHTVMGMEDKRNQVLIQNYHWSPVLHKEQPQILGHLCKNQDEHIIVDGMGLYMRPEYLNKEAMQETESETAYQLSQQMKSLRMNSAEQVGAANTFIKKQTVAQPIE